MLTLADAIIEEQVDTVAMMLQDGVPANQIDEYGFTPLIEAAIANNVEIAQLLIHYGAATSQQDMLGGTALHWAAENNNVRLSELLLQNGANPNAFNFAGQPVLVMPLLRQQQEIKKLLLQYGANLFFAQDYINTKQLGHMFELIGTADIVDPQNHFVEVDFEGFFLEVSLAMIAESVAQFNNHFAARQLRRYVGLIQVIINTLNRSAELIKYQQYQVDTQKHQPRIQALLEQEPLIIPVAYEGHAITFIKLGGLLVKCDRREESRLYDNIVIYQINQPKLCHSRFIQQLIYTKQSDQFINHDLPNLLELHPITEIKVPAQISGNCSWANVEACLPALFFLLSSEQAEDAEQSMIRRKNLALNFFNQWREWNKERSLRFCIQSFQQVDSIRKACKAEMLAAILFQTCGGGTPLENERAEAILSVLINSPYAHVLQNYVKSYCFEDHGEEGKNFLRLLRNHGYRI